MGLLGYQNRQRVVAADMTHSAVCQFKLRGRPSLAQAPPDIVHNQALSARSVLPVAQLGPMIEARDLIDDAVLTGAYSLVIWAHEKDPTVKGLPGVASGDRVEDTARFSRGDPS